MRKLNPLAAALLLLASLSPPAAAMDVAARFCLGVGFVDAGDLKDGIQGYNDFSAALYGRGLQGKFEAPGLGWEPSAEIVFRLGRRWGIGLGFGYSSYSKSSEMTTAVAASTVTERLTAGVEAVPIELNFHLFLPLSRRLTIGAWAGPGVALSRLNWNYRMSVALESQSGEDVFDFHARRPVFGVQAGIGVFLKLSNAFDIGAEIRGRLASAAGFKGSWTESGSGDLWASGDSGEATAWVLDWTYGSKPYRQLSFSASKPGGGNLSNVEEARIGLSGIGLRIGFRVRIPFNRSGGD